MKGEHAEQLPSYVDEFMWGGADPSTSFSAILHVQYLSLHEDVFWRCVRCIGDSNAYTCTVGRN